MSWNGKASGSKTSNQDYMNLLYSDSESDSRVPDLKLPPIKGKKQKRKRASSSGNRPEETSCGLWPVLKVFFYVIVLASVLMLSIVSFWSLKRINELQIRISDIKNSGTGTSDIMIESRLTKLNSTLTTLKVGPIQSMTANIAKIQSQLEDLKTETESLKSSLGDHEDLVNIPKKLDTLTSTVATISSDVIGLKDTSKKLTSSLDALSKNVTALEANFGSLDVTSRDVQAPTLAGLSEDIHNVNQTLQKEIIEMSQTLQDFSVPKTSGGREGSQGELSELSDQVSVIMDEVTKLREAKSGCAALGEFMEFKAATQQDLESVNSSLVVLNTEMESLTSSLATLEGTVINLTSVVDKMDSRKESPEPKETPEPVKHDEPEEHGTVEQPNEGTNGDEGSEETNAPPEEDTTIPQPTADQLKIEGVDSLQALQNSLSEVPHQPNGQYRAEDLQSLVKDPDLLVPYDLDKNGMYTEEELAKALGLDQERSR